MAVVGLGLDLTLTPLRFYIDLISANSGLGFDNKHKFSCYPCF